MDGTPTHFSSWATRALLVAALLLGLGAIVLLHDTRFDDAYITFRYGQNLAVGRGPVFNPGERVLGTTSPGQMLSSAAVYPFAGLEGTPSWMAALGCIAWVAQALFVFAILRRAFGDWTALLAAAALALGAAGSDMRVALETNQVLAFNLAALWMALEKRWRVAALLAALGVLFRPDAALFALPLAALCVYEERWRALGPALVFVAVLAPWFLFATFYYGTPIPLTASTKFQRATLLEYGRHIYDHLGIYIRPNAPMIGLLVWVLGLGGAVRLVRAGPAFALLAVYPLLHYLAYLKLRPFTVHTWHLYPAEAMMVVLAMVGLGALFERRPWAVRWLAAAVALSLLSMTSFYTAARIATHDVSRWTGGRDQAYREIAKFLIEHGDSEREHLAAVEVGTVAYLTDFSAMDLGWLVSRPGEMLDRGELRWLLLDPIYHSMVPAGAPLVFAAESGGFRAELYDLWKGNPDPEAADRIRGADWGL